MTSPEQQPNRDARSGEVSAANFRARQAPPWATIAVPAGATPLAVDDARARAAAYAAAHQPAFPQLAPRLTYAPSNPANGEFVWQARDAASGAWLPSYLLVRVSRATGDIADYSWSVNPYNGPMNPQLSAEEARARAAVLVRTDVRYAGVLLDAPALEAYAPYALNAEQDTPRLVWAFPDGARAAIDAALYIDALTGEVIRRSPAG